MVGGLRDLGGKCQSMKHSQIDSEKSSYLWDLKKIWRRETSPEKLEKDMKMRELKLEALRRQFKFLKGLEDDFRGLRDLQ
jgi:hypothetical protein